MTDRWAVVAGLAGSVLVAMVGAPLSVDLVFLVGPDHPTYIGEQFAALFFGAAATAVGIVLARHWRWLIVAGAVVTVAAQAVRVPRPQGLSVRVGGTGSSGPVPDIGAHPVWVCVLVGATAILVVGVLGAAQSLGPRVGASVAGSLGCAGFFGVSVVGRMRGWEHWPRFAVVIVAAAVAVFAVSWVRPAPVVVHPAGSWVRLVGAGAALMWLVPTMIVAIRGQAIFATATGGVVGLVVLGVALVAGRAAGRDGVLAVAMTGLVLAAPVVMLVLLYDVLLGTPWYSWPIALAGVLVGAAAAAGPWTLRAGVVAAAGLSMVGIAAQTYRDGSLVIWLFLALTVAAVAVTVGSATQVLAEVAAAPALSGLGTLAALGVFGTLNFVRAGGNQAALGRTLGSTASWVSTVLLLAAAALMLVLGSRRSTSAARSGQTATGQEQRSR